MVLLDLYWTMQDDTLWRADLLCVSHSQCLPGFCCKCTRISTIWLDVTSPTPFNPHFVSLIHAWTLDAKKILDVGGASFTLIRIFELPWNPAYCIPDVQKLGIVALQKRWLPIEYSQDCHENTRHLDMEQLIRTGELLAWSFKPNLQRLQEDILCGIIWCMTRTITSCVAEAGRGSSDKTVGLRTFFSSQYPYMNPWYMAINNLYLVTFQYRRYLTHIQQDRDLTLVLPKAESCSLPWPGRIILQKITPYVDV